MNDYQKIFLVFYAILYGAMLASLIGLRPFQWGWILRECQPTLRLIVAIVIVNFLPAGYAGWLLECWLSGVVIKPIGILNIFALFFVSLSVFAFYRFFILLIALDSRRKVFYSDRELDPNKEEYKNLQSRLKGIGVWWGQLLGILFYFGIPYLFYRLWIKRYLGP